MSNLPDLTPLTAERDAALAAARARARLLGQTDALDAFLAQTAKLANFFPITPRDLQLRLEIAALAIWWHQ